MSIFMRKSEAKNSSELRALNSQWEFLQANRRNAMMGLGGGIGGVIQIVGNNDPEFAKAKLYKDTIDAINAGRVPAETYRDFDTITKIEQIPAGEHATLRRLLSVAKAVGVGKETYEYRQASDAGRGETSMSGQIGIKADKVDYKYAGTVIPIHDIATNRRWREIEAMRSEGFDALADDVRESERELMTTVGNYLWDGNPALTIDGHSWLGIRLDPTVAQGTITVDMVNPATDAELIRSEVARLRDILRIGNNCSADLSMGVSREMMTAFERPFSTAEGTYGTIGDYIMKLRGISEIYEDPRLTDNQLVMYWADTMGFHAVSGMGLSTYSKQRMHHNDDYTIIKWMATGFMAKNDYSGDTCALYAES